MRDPILLALTGFFTLSALVRPLLGLLAFIGLSILGLHSFTWGVARAFPHSLVIGVATIVGFLISSETKRFPRERESLIVLALWVLFTLSTFFALKPELALDKLLFVSKIFLMMFLCTAIVNTPARLHILVRVVALSLGFLALKTGPFVLVTGFQEKVYGPENTYLFQENAIGIALATNLPLLLYLFQTERSRWLRLMVGAMFLLSYPAVIATFSRGAWLSLAAVTVLLLMYSRRKMLAIGLVVVLAVGGVVWQSFFVSGRVAARWDTLVNYEQDGSAISRFWNWEFCRRVGLGRPLGGGFDLYSIDAYLRFYPEFVAQYPGKVWVCHSMWMQFLAEHGVLGFLLGTGLIASCLLSLRRLNREASKRRTQTRPGDLAPMLIVAFVGYITGGTFLDVTYHELLYQLVAMVVISKALWRQDAQTAMQADDQIVPNAKYGVYRPRQPQVAAAQPAGGAFEPSR